MSSGTPARRPSKRWTGPSCGARCTLFSPPPQQVDIPRYTAPLAALLQDLESTYHYTPLDAFLVLKDILGKMWTEQHPAGE